MKLTRFLHFTNHSIRAGLYRVPAPSTVLSIPRISILRAYTLNHISTISTPIRIDRTLNLNNSTVYALSTPPGKSAIAVVRITGPLCIHIYKSLCPSHPPPKPRQAALRALHDPLSPSHILDPAALLLYFPSPHSFTGEDVLELHLHGGPAVLKSVLSAIPKCNSTLPPNHKNNIIQSKRISPAEPGDFTKRAFHNSRLTLPEIEALSDLLSAETERQRTLSITTSTTGAANLTSLYTAWHALLLSARGELEALIDFSEDQQFDDPPAVLLRNVTTTIQQLKKGVEAYLSNAVKGELLRNGINIALVGAPNAGKSSLLNCIVGREAAIVSSRAGTTRDVVDVTVDLGGWMVVLGDTAGFRVHNNTSSNDSNGKEGGYSGNRSGDTIGKFEDIDEIEVEGMRRARKRVSDADVVVFLCSIEDGEGIVGLKMEEEAVRVAREALEIGKEVLVVVNKIDKVGVTEVPGEIVEEIRGRMPGLGVGRIIVTSCTEDGYEGTIQELLRALTGIFQEMTSAQSGFEDVEGVSLEGVSKSVWAEAIGASSRQRALIEECYHYLENFLSGLEDNQNDGSDEIEEDIDIVLKAEALRRAARCISQIMGRGEGASTVDEVLGVVFEKFCVGK
ncbi:mitochondrial splicing system protein [Orbilia ellipsospora]|uniref:Mitochondrial splicing system protein n=1 Tax=Orbilia ellipsospora TaxID=2528407 RepID=A0AAV9XJP5_9PEZI